MGRFNLGKLKKETKGWKETLVDRIHQGKLLPILSHSIYDDLVFGNQDELIAGWMDYTDYSRGKEHSLAEMTQFQSVMFKADPDVRADDDYIKEIYLDFLVKALASIADEDLAEELEADANADKFSFSEAAQRLEMSNGGAEDKTVLSLLADLPLPIYITTSYYSFLEMTLTQAGKNPRTEICYWDKRLRSIPSVFEEEGYRPTPQEPLVYHLHGLDKYPNSMVLTEDDHLDFVSNIGHDWDGIPLLIRQALADSSLMLLGYKLSAWDFRVVFRGLVKASIDQRRPTSVAIQLKGDETERNYLKNYLSQQGRFEVYWGTVDAFIQELWQGWAG